MFEYHGRKHTLLKKGNAMAYIEYSVSKEEIDKLKKVF